MVLLRDSPDDFRALVGDAAREFRMPETFVEKDYWVTELLRAISEPLDGMHVVFKGGTSLSKVHLLTRRFSEDVDVLVVFDQPGLTKGARHRLIKELDTRACEALGSNSSTESSSTGVHRTTVYPYLPFRMQVLAPERTLVEKLSLVHNYSARDPETRDSLVRAGRHFYDIWALLKDDGVRAELSKTNVASLAEEVVRQSRAGLDPSAIDRPADGFATSPAFDPTADCSAVIRDAYRQIEPLVLDPLPALEDVFAMVKENAALL